MRKRVLLWPAPWLTGCGGPQSMLAPEGPGAAAVADVWWLMLWGALAVLALVSVLALYAVYRRPERRRPLDARWLIVGGGVVLPTVTLSALLVYGFGIGSALGTGGEAPLRIEVTGHRWWWEVRYPGAPEVVTANEIHIPVDRTVEVAVRSADVIHSFWVPQLAGKLDMIPGHDNTLRLRADTAGAYRGQCAEFCGAQHAHMAFWVIAESPERFAAWRERRSRPAREPEGAAARRGRASFLAARCVECHTVRGTAADGERGPDLTHVGSRRTIAAGTLERSPETFARWITDNQRIKPGNLMASFADMDAATVRDIAAYLESLR